MSEQTLKDMLKPSFFWNKGRIYLSDYTYLELHNADKLLNLEYIEFIRRALNEKHERDFGKPKRWIKKEDECGLFIECPKCELTILFDANKPRNFNYCLDCGQRLLPPEGEAKK